MRSLPLYFNATPCINDLLPTLNTYVLRISKYVEAQGLLTYSIPFLSLLQVCGFFASGRRSSKSSKSAGSKPEDINHSDTHLDRQHDELALEEREHTSSAQETTDEDEQLRTDKPRRKASVSLKVDDYRKIG